MSKVELSKDETKKYIGSLFTRLNGPYSIDVLRITAVSECNNSNNVNTVNNNSFRCEWELLPTIRIPCEDTPDKRYVFCDFIIIDHDSPFIGTGTGGKLIQYNLPSNSHTGPQVLFINQGSHWSPTTAYFVHSVRSLNTFQNQETNSYDSKDIQPSSFTNSKRTLRAPSMRYVKGPNVQSTKYL